jgi:streptogramin lyase
VKSASGEKLEGVTVFAKIEGRPVTVSVFTDDQGAYYFPPMEEGKYQVWAQAVGFEAARADVNLRGASQRKDFLMKVTKDFFLQLSGDEQEAALPEDTAAHRRMKDVFMRNCTSCHGANVALQSKFDEQGWEAIINAMSRTNTSGGFRPEDQRPNPIMTYFKKDLAAYLAEMRGPGPSPMQLKVPERPTGDAVLPVIYSYDLPMEEGGGYDLNNGNDWTFGPSMGSGGGQGGHDAQVDPNGNIWFTYNEADSVDRTVGKVNGKTGEVTNIKYPGKDGHAATTHGIALAHDGMIWVTLNTNGAINAAAATEEAGEAPGKIARIDPKTGKMQVFQPDAGMAGANISIDEDGQGNIWASTGRGALRFDPKTQKFKEFVSLTQPGGSYGMTGDRDGNGWWTQISIDIIGHSDVETGKALEVKVPRNTTTFLKEGDLSPEDLKIYGPRGTGTEAPRRAGADKNGEDVWVPDYSGNNLLRINTHTLKTTFYPAPRAGLNPYMAVVDSAHNVWMNLQGSDYVARFEPKTEKWTLFSWPLRGTSTRAFHISDQNGQVQLSAMFYNANRVGRMVIRSKQDIQALKARAQQTVASN